MFHWFEYGAWRWSCSCHFLWADGHIPYTCMGCSLCQSIAVLDDGTRFTTRSSIMRCTISFYLYHTSSVYWRFQGDILWLVTVCRSVIVFRLIIPARRIPCRLVVGVYKRPFDFDKSFDFFLQLLAEVVRLFHAHLSGQNNMNLDQEATTAMKRDDAVDKTNSPVVSQNDPSDLLEKLRLSCVTGEHLNLAWISTHVIVTSWKNSQTSCTSPTACERHQMWRRNYVYLSLTPYIKICWWNWANAMVTLISRSTVNVEAVNTWLLVNTRFSRPKTRGPAAFFYLTDWLGGQSSTSTTTFTELPERWSHWRCAVFNHLLVIKVGGFVSINYK